MSGWAVAVWVTAVVVIAALLMVLSRRRDTPRLTFAVSDVPEIDELLPTLTGVTGSTIYSGNHATVWQNGALFPALIDDINGAKRTVHLEHR